LRIALAGLAALAIAMGIGRFAFTPILPMMQAEGLVTLQAGGWLASANYAGYLAGALWAAVHRVSSQTAIRAGLAGIGVTTLAMAVATGLAGAMVLRALAGVASAWVLVHVSSWCLERLSAAGRSVLYGVVFAGVGIGIIAAGLACLALMATGSGSANAWALLGVIALLLCVPLWRSFPSLRPAMPASEADREIQNVTTTDKQMSAGWRKPWTLLVVCYGAFGFGYIIPATYIPAMAREAAGDPQIFGWAWPVFGAAAAASTLGAAAALRRFSARRLWIAAQLVMAAGVAAPLALGGLAGPLAAALCVGGTFVAVTMLGMHEARRTAGERSAQLMAAMTAAFALGQIAGPVLVSAWLAAGGTLAFGLAAASVALVASAAALLIPNPPRSSSEPP
jgi:predicted MFS family arabinose efflux permease